MTTAREILNEAADLIENAPRLARGVYDQTDSDGTCYCAVGAIQHAAIGNPAYDSVGKAIYALARHIPGSRDPYIQVFEWNDDPSTTKEDVVAKLRETAASL